MERLLEIMRQLRAPNGCPWDREQTHESLKPYLLEEAAEAVDAVDDPNRLELADELGDVLLQVAFHSVIAEESKDFTYHTVENAIIDKLIRRHPHVFADVLAVNSETVVTNWEAIKVQERLGKPEKHSLEQIPKAFGALARAQEVTRVLNQTHTKNTVLDVLNNANSDSDGVSSVLEAVVAWAQSAGVNTEISLRQRTNQKIMMYRNET